MIPSIGVLIATYAIARLLQAPIEVAPLNPVTRWVLIACISVPAILVIGFLALDLVLSGAKLPQMP